MSLDAPAPDPPDLEGDPDEYEDVSVEGTDYHRDDLQSFLEDGAWEQAFESWAETTNLDREAFDVAVDLGLFDQFDFFWDDFADRVGYHAPGLPENWRERDIHADLDSWGTVSGINAALAELGAEVSRVLKDDYVDWEADYDAPDDLPDF
ncbi:hypothetical protein [Halobacterium litoreum]|uniref:DUF7992 domain-containing protein n=1 Tax=Halobacterium litoreum TaxID=2039234 RepID=A0ABD5NB76_9EURY|nr:hypothetical protein [Halobacterium litoreum]UHH12093.1 hypothetical protein LT972_07975 [Halobacterium litoreum]